jgi:hypothetical protein
MMQEHRRPREPSVVYIDEATMGFADRSRRLVPGPGLTMGIVMLVVLATGAGAHAASKRRGSTPKFSDYPASPAMSAAKAPLSLTKEDRPFRGQLRRGYFRPVNFAGKYVLATWGCGMECMMGAAIDSETGTVHWLPGTVCCWCGMGEGEPDLLPFKFRIDSSLIVLGGYLDEKGVKGDHYYRILDGAFVHIDTKPVAKGP